MAPIPWPPLEWDPPQLPPPQFSMGRGPITSTWVFLFTPFNWLLMMALCWFANYDHMCLCFLFGQEDDWIFIGVVKERWGGGMSPPAVCWCDSSARLASGVLNWWRDALASSLQMFIPLLMTGTSFSFFLSPSSAIVLLQRKSFWLGRKKKSHRGLLESIVLFSILKTHTGIQEVFFSLIPPSSL